MTIALVAHDTKKELMVQFCIAYCGILCKHNLLLIKHISLFWLLTCFFLSQLTFFYSRINTCKQLMHLKRHSYASNPFIIYLTCKPP